MKNKVHIQIFSKVTLIIMTILVIAFFGVSVNALNYYVDSIGTDDLSHGNGTGIDAFQTIQYAIDNVVSGNIINVGVGTYNERILINKSNLTLIGSNIEETIINSYDNSSYVVEIIANETILDGFTLQNSKNGVSSYGINLVNSNDCILGNLVIKNISALTSYSMGLYLINSNRNSIEGIEIKDLEMIKVNVTNGGTYALWLTNSSDNIFNDITISNINSGADAQGIMLYTNSNRNDFSGTTISNLITSGSGNFNYPVGISIYSTTLSSDNNTFLNTEISGLTTNTEGWSAGIQVRGTGTKANFGNTFTNTIIHDITSTIYAYGVAITTGSSVTFDDIHIYNLSATTSARGFNVWKETSPNSSVTITNANIEVGIGDGIRIGTGIDSSLSSIHSSIISGNSLFAIKSYGLNYFDATENWFGSNNESIIESFLNGNVTYNPYYMNMNMTILNTEFVHNGNCYVGVEYSYDNVPYYDSVFGFNTFNNLNDAFAYSDCINIYLESDISEENIIYNKNQDLIGNYYTISDSVISLTDSIDYNEQVWGNIIFNNSIINFGVAIDNFKFWGCEFYSTNDNPIFNVSSSNDGWTNYIALLTIDNSHFYTDAIPTDYIGKGIFKFNSNEWFSPDSYYGEITIKNSEFEGAGTNTIFSTENIYPDRQLYFMGNLNFSDNIVDGMVLFGITPLGSFPDFMENGLLTIENNKFYNSININDFFTLGTTNNVKINNNYFNRTRTYLIQNFFKNNIEIINNTYENGERYFFLQLNGLFGSRNENEVNPTSLIVKDNNIINSFGGIFVSGADYLRVENNNISATTDFGIYFVSAISPDGQSDMIIQNNFIENNDSSPTDFKPFIVENQNGAYILNNTIENVNEESNEYGFYVIDTLNSFFAYNILIGNFDMNITTECPLFNNSNNYLEYNNFGIDCNGCEYSNPSCDEGYYCDNNVCEYLPPNTTTTTTTLQPHITGFGVIGDIIEKPNVYINIVITLFGIAFVFVIVTMVIKRKD